MGTIIMANYKAEHTDDGVLIRDFELSRTTTMEQRPDFKYDLTVTTFKHIIKNFDARVALGKVGAFVMPVHAGPAIGRILSLKIVDEELVGDILVTHPTAIRMIDRGEFTERSIEWAQSPNDAYLKGVALLSAEFGQDSAGWPDLTVEYTKALIDKEFQEFSNYNTKSVKYGDTLPTRNKETHMPISEEEWTRIGEMIASAVSSGIEKMDEIHADDEDPKKMDEPGHDDEPVNEEKLEKALAEVAKQKVDITVDGYIRNLSDKGYTNKSHLKKSFTKFGNNMVAMKVEYQRLMEKANDDITLEMEEIYETPKLEEMLKAEHVNYCKTHQSDIDFDTFSSVVQGKNKTDLSGKTANAVT